MILLDLILLAVRDFLESARLNWCYKKIRRGDHVLPGDELPRPARPLNWFGIKLLKRANILIVEHELDNTC